MIKLVKSRGEVRGDRSTSENIYLLLYRDVKITKSKKSDFSKYQFFFTRVGYFSNTSRKYFPV